MISCTFYWWLCRKWVVRICHWLFEHKGELDQNLKRKLNKTEKKSMGLLSYIISSVNTYYYEIPKDIYIKYKTKLCIFIYKIQEGHFQGYTKCKTISMYIFLQYLLLLSISNYFLFLIPQCLVHEDISIFKIFSKL